MCPELPPTTEERIADNRAQTVADSVMYREALASAAEARGWSVHWYERERVFLDAAAALGREDIDVFLYAMGRSIGPPWPAETQARGRCGAGYCSSPRAALLNCDFKQLICQASRPLYRDHVTRSATIGSTAMARRAGK